MKRLLLIITSLFLISQTMAQGPVEVDVWKKSKNKNRLKNIFKSSDIPNTFASTLPNGESVIYEKWDRPDVKIETSTGKKITYKPNVYRTKSKKVQSVISYDGKKWDGMATSNGNEYYNISSDIVKKDTLKSQKMSDGDHDDYIITPNSNDGKKLKRFGQTLDANTPVSEQTLSPIDLYNPLIRINKTVTVYVEVEKSLHTIWGNNLSTSISKVTTIMNNVSDLYDREGINVVNNHIYVWETQDPYSNFSTTGDKLYTFRSNLTARTPTTTTSHFKHLFSGTPNEGGQAFIGANGTGDGYEVRIPELDPVNCVSVSCISTLPVVNSSTSYNWPVYVVTHEMGHNLGSRHTQSCSWRNEQGVSIGRLDSCVEAEDGVCAGPTKLSFNGTIMSYCHIRGNSVNFNLGFGKYPRFVIRANLYFSPEIPFDNVVIPTVTTNPISLLTPTSARSGGVVTNDGGGLNIASGVCWSTSPNPTINLTTKTSDGTSNTFTSNITGLLASTIYYVRSYVTNSAGTGYGQQVQFTTSAATAPIVSTLSPTLIGGTFINTGGNVTNSGGQTVTSRGVCWSTSPTPTINLPTRTSDGTGPGSFTSSITGLSIATTYYIRAYATNSLGTSYGSEIVSTTSPSLLPTVVTNTVSNFRNYTGDPNSSQLFTTLFADCGGNVVNTGGSLVTARGLCWSTSPNPTTLNSKTSNGTGVGEFISTWPNQQLSGLLKGTLYYVRAYATNSSGTSYGDVVTFTTPNTPTLVLNSITEISPTGARFTGTLTTRGIDACAYYFRVGTTPGGPYTFFTGVNSCGVLIRYPSGSYTRTINGEFSPNTTYYAIMAASSFVGESTNSPEISFKTAVASPPSVTTGPLTAGANTLAPTFTSNCNVTNSGGSTVTERGICISTNQNPTTSDTKVVSVTSGTGSYTVTTLPLLPNVTYYARAYAINSSGTGYGEQVTGLSSVTIVTTLAATNITSTSARLGGSVVLAQNATLTDCGILLKAGTGVIDINSFDKYCVATTANPWSCTITGLLPSTTYSYVAYIDGTNRRGNVLTFTTSGSTGFANVTTTTISAIGSTTATGGGNVTSIGGSAVTAKGICWSTSPSPTINLPTRTTNGSGIGSFVSSMTGLSPGTLYYVRSYATNTSGTTYGAEVTFTTLSQPVVTTTPITFITSSTSSSGGNVTSDGGSAVTARGVCWSTSVNPTILLSTRTSNGTGTGTFGSSITGLSANTLYYVRAYATNAIGTSYGQQETFTTLTASTPPTVTTTVISAITSTTATGGGNVTSDGGSTITNRGVCWSTSATPTILLSTKTSNGTGTGSFTSSITGLTPNTTYYVRAYATNVNGTSYGIQVSFTTLSNLPTLSTTSVTSITTTTATSGGNISSDGGSAVTSRGVCWSTSVNPTISNSITTDGTGTGGYTSSITGLSASTTYYVRAYATNVNGTTYGSQVSFITTSISLPVLTTSAVSSITTTTATSGGNISSDGSSAVTARGVCWSTSPSPTISNSITTDGSGTGSFLSDITGLSPGTTYYVRAYATNTAGTSYGSEVSFITSVDLPTVTTSPISSITINSALGGGEVTNVGGGFVGERGVCWSTSPSPTILNSVTIDGDGIGSYTSSMLGLSSGTTYYVRAYATNEAGTSYGNQVSFTTISIGLPVLTTSSISSITTTTATSGGNISSDGSSAVTARGVCWSTSPSPTIDLPTRTTSGSGVGSFVSSITGLTPGTLYYVRAYATNGAGTAYGSQVSFTTTSISLPVLTTSSVSSITPTTATSGGNISSDGGSTVTARGVCWSTSQNPTTSNSITTNGSGVGSFVSSITGLTPGTLYYVRAYATNGAGTAYGSQVSFTSSTSIPTLTTTSISGITSSSASSGGNITNSGASIITSRGVVWSTSINPTISLATRTNNGSGTGIFTSNISGLLPSTTYYVRSYATNTQGTAYGNQLSFTTLPSTGGSCIVSNLSAYKNANNQWVFKFNINSNCSSYTVNVCRYNLSNPSVQPTLTTTAVACGIRNSMSSYVPSTAERTAGFIERVMSPQPSLFGFWYSVDIKCNAASCTGTNTTKFFFFRQ